MRTLGLLRMARELATVVIGAEAATRVAILEQLGGCIRDRNLDPTSAAALHHRLDRGHANLAGQSGRCGQLGTCVMHFGVLLETLG
ncbi:MAG: hypothetical protein ACEQSB_01235 [Undibacterium sp.]